MANLRTVDDLKSDVLFRSGEQTDGTSDFDAQVMIQLNRAYRVIWNGGSEFDENVNETWWWLFSTAPGTITLLPKIDGGSVAVTNNNTGITLSSSPAQDLTGWYFKTDDHPDIFRVAAHAGATEAAVTIDSVYTGNTASAASYKVFKLNYGLPTTVLHVNGPMRVYRNSRQDIDGIESKALDRNWPLERIQGGVPRAFAPVGEQEVRFSHYGMATAGDFVRADFDFMKNPGDLASGSSEPLVPIQYRHILTDMALAYLMQDKEDSRMQSVITQAQSGLRAMAKEHRRRMALSSRTLGKIQPRQRDLDRFRGPIRTESGVIIG